MALPMSGIGLIPPPLQLSIAASKALEEAIQQRARGEMPDFATSLRRLAIAAQQPVIELCAKYPGRMNVDGAFEFSPELIERFTLRYSGDVLGVSMALAILRRLSLPDLWGAQFKALAIHRPLRLRKPPSKRLKT